MTRFILFITLVASVLFLNACKSFPNENRAYSPKEVSEAASSKGINAVVNLADHAGGKYAFTWSNPTIKSNAYNFSITSKSSRIKERLEKLSKDDRVKIIAKVSADNLYSFEVVKLKFMNEIKPFPYREKSYSVEEVIEAISREGVYAIVHGADHVRKLYIVSWSSPSNFFNRYNFVITSDSPEIRKEIAKLKRGDRIKVQGKVDVNKGQAHFVIKKFELNKKYDSKVKHTAGEFSRKTKMPEELLNKKREVFYVHATDESGKVIVLEYGDTIVPMIVKNPELTKDLYRGDYVDLAYTIRKSEKNYRATHIVLDGTAKEPVKVLDSIVKLHDQELNYEGRLVMFPKSPTINRNIFAIEVAWQDKTKAPRYFTLLPRDFTLEKFEEILKKLQTAWDAGAESIYKGRNKYIHTKLRVKIKGRGNVVSENQANPQIFADIEDLQIK
jgi:hypothetical protein